MFLMNVTAAKTAGKAPSRRYKHQPVYLNHFVRLSVLVANFLVKLDNNVSKNQMHLASVLPADVVSVFNKKNQQISIVSAF